MLAIQPLDSLVFDSLKPEGKFERIGMCLPIIGWLISNHTRRKRYQPVRDSIVRILEARPIIDASIWGDERHQEIAKLLCSKIKEEIGWPNDRFIPRDSADVILWMVEDDLEIVEIIVEIEDRFKIKISDDQILSICKGTMGDFVELIASLKQVAERE